MALDLRFSGPVLAAILVAAPMAAGVGAGMAAAKGAAVMPGPIAAEVVDVLDGDTLMVRATIWLDQAVETHVRLEGVDAPELHARCPQEREKAVAARELMRGLVRGGQVRLFDVRNDKYGGRVRAHVLNAAGNDLASALLAAGLARPYHGERRESWCPLTGG
jgi:endonuclease YncB( thermonuclease family)